MKKKPKKPPTIPERPRFLDTIIKKGV